MTGYGALEKARRGSGDHLLKTYQRGRVCQKEGCDTVLSFYNPLSYCALHFTKEAVPKPKCQQQHKKPEPFPKICVYEPCGREFLTTSHTRKYCSDLCRIRSYADKHPNLNPRPTKVKSEPKVKQPPKRRHLGQKTLKVLFFFLEKPSKHYCRLEIAEGANIWPTTVYSILAALQERDWLEYKLGPKKAGNRKKYYRLSLKGIREARQLKAKEEMVSRR